MVASAPLSRPDTTSQSWQQAQPNVTGVQDEAALLATMGVGSEEELGAEWAAAEAEAIAVLHKYVLAATRCFVRPQANPLLPIATCFCFAGG